MTNKDVDERFTSFFDRLYIKKYETGELARFALTPAQKQFLKRLVAPVLQKRDLDAINSMIRFRESQLAANPESSGNGYRLAERAALKRCLELLGHDEKIKSAADSLVTETVDGVEKRQTVNGAQPAGNYYEEN